MSKKTRNTILLLCTDFVWGIAFVAQTTGGDKVGACAFTSIRFFIAALVLLPVIATFDKLGMTTNKPQNSKDKKLLWAAGICCGLSLCAASIFQQVGINMGSEAGKAGFLTAMYILMVPILGIFLKKKCPINIWIGVFIALVGLYLLCMNGAFKLKISDAMLLLCALCFAVQIHFISHFAPKVDSIRLACIEFFVTGVCSAVPMFIFDWGHSISGIVQWSAVLFDSVAWIAILYAGIFSGGIGYTLQIVGQNGLNPTFASMVMSLESVVSVFAGWIILNQELTIRELVGCVLIFAAIIIAQLEPISHKEKVRKLS